MLDIVPVITVAIICLQLFFFVKNLKRMSQFSEIFSEDSSWSLHRDAKTHFVDGVEGEGNQIFESIKNSINKYLGSNSGSVIDFGLLKDAIDRHCDSVEEDISTQTPVPLYWGLAGTMAGVIIGLFNLIQSGALDILTNASANTNQLKDGVQALLDGVAWAMLASICGILLTTANSLLFKRRKLQEDTGKNSFLAWLQSKLLPELPSDTSQALNNLVRNLNAFNDTFAENTTNLGNALETVNQSYAVQADIIRAVHDMDVMSMATANVRVLRELKECTGRLETFNNYLSAINGYTEAIHRFEAQFETQASRLHILEEIRDFFCRYNDEIARTTADADQTLQETLRTIKESTEQSVNDFHARFVEQGDQFRRILQTEKEAFEEHLKHVNAQFDSQMAQMPQIAAQLENISAIPEKLDKLIVKVEQSNQQMANNVSAAIGGLRYAEGAESASWREYIPEPSIPSWMKYMGLIALVIIALACIFQVVIYFCF